MRILFDTLLNLIMVLVFGAVMFFVAREAHATRNHATFVTHCPGCDDRVPDYGSSAWDRRVEQGKSFPGDGGTPYYQQESNVQRDNREQMEREARQREERNRQQQDLYKSYKPYGY